MHGAALMTGTTVEVEWDHYPPSLPVRGNAALGGRWVRSLAERGREVHPAGVLPDVLAASTDFGNVSVRVPGIHPMIAIAGPDQALHTPEFATAEGSPAGETAALDRSVGLAHTAWDFLADDALAAPTSADPDRSTLSTATTKATLTDRLLNGVERVGNKLPEPFTLFVILFLITGVVSTGMAWADVEVVVPGGDGEPVPMRGLFTGEGLTWFTTNIGENYLGFPPLKTVLPILLAVGIAEKTGMLAALARPNVSPVTRRRARL